MKPHTIKLLWLGALALLVSTAIFNRISSSLDSTTEQPELAMLASLYSGSNPHVLATALKSSDSETSVSTKATEAARTTLPKADFSLYIQLHRSRLEQPATHNGIDYIKSSR